MVARTPGVGPKKVAERIVTELKDKAPAYSNVDPALVRLSGELDEKRAPQPIADAVSALMNLGYAQALAAAAVAAASRNAGDNAEVEYAVPARPEGTSEVKEKRKLGKADRELVAAATAAIKSRYRDDWQEVGAALRTRSGQDLHRRQLRCLSRPHGGLRRGGRAGARRRGNGRRCLWHRRLLPPCGIRRRGTRTKPSRSCRRAAPAVNLFSIMTARRA